MATSYCSSVATDLSFDIVFTPTFGSADNDFLATLYFAFNSYVITPLPSIWQHFKLWDCLEVKREYYHSCFMLPTCYFFNGHS